MAKPDRQILTEFIAPQAHPPPPRRRGMKVRAGAVLAVAGVALLLVALTPSHAYAWAPGTHAYLS